MTVPNSQMYNDFGGVEPLDFSSLSDRRDDLHRHDADSVISLINKARFQGSVSLDLSHKHLIDIPEEVYELEHLENLYLEGNKLAEIPANLFEDLPNLKWLDLRNNNIFALPATIGNHRNLKTVLLQDNKLKELPPELGLVDTLYALNLHGNPLQFPPGKVVKKGTNDVLNFLRAHITQKSSYLNHVPNDIRLEGLKLEDQESLSMSGSSVEDLSVAIASKKAWREHAPHLLEKQYSGIDKSDFDGPRPTSVSLHKPVSYLEYRQMQHERLKKAGALGIISKDKKKKGKRKSKAIPSPPKLDLVESKAIEERRLAQLQDLNEKQRLMEQRRKDVELLKNWREETKELQRKNYVKAVRSSQQDFYDPDYEPKVKPPYGTDPAHMKMVSKEERIKQEVKSKHEQLKSMDSPFSKFQFLDARAAHEKNLQDKIQEHTKKMHERRKKPKGTPQEEMEAARKEISELEGLQHQLKKHLMDLE